MDQTTKDSLKKAINLLKAGDKSAAIPLLTGVLKKEPKLEQGWYLLGMALDAKDKKLRAFNQVIKLNPEHTKARQQIDKLEKPTAPPAPPVEETPPPTPEPASPVEPAFSDSPSTEADEDDLPPDMSDTPPTEITGSMRPDFDLPDWMQQDTFDATEQLPEIQKADEEAEPETGSAAWEADEDEDEPVEIPDWARSTGPPPMGPDLSAMEEEPEPEEPEWLKSSSVEQPEEPPKEQAFTGYYLDEDEAEEDVEAENGEEDAEEGEPEWLRSMVEEDEEDGKKKKRRKKKERMPLTFEEKKRRRRRIFLLVMILLCSGLGAAGYFFQEELQPYYDEYLPPVLTQVAPVTDLMTEGAPITDLLTRTTPTSSEPSATPPQQPTLAPTWTPAETLIPTYTPRPAQATAAAEITPTITPTSFPLPEDTQNEIKIIQEQVVAIRNLPGPESVVDDIVPKLKLRQILEDWMLEESYLDSLEKDQIVYRALGLVNSEYDLVEAALNSRADAIGGFYLPEDNQVNVIGTGFYGLQKYVYSHEYAHAIQDENFDLTSLGVYPTCTQAAQTCLAIRSLVEGEATLVEQLWFEEYPPEIEYQDILNFQAPSTLFQGSPAPEYFSQNTVFPYTYGYDFVSYLYENGGWDAVNRAYRVLPATTEQIMHPVKYDQREVAMYLNHPDITSIFDEDWELIRADTLGEWENYLLLAHSDYPNANQSESAAKIAAAGWGADQYQVFYNDRTREVLMSVYWTWDSQGDSSEFYDLMIDYLKGRFDNAETDGPGNGRCWFLRGEMSCLYRNGKQILWLHSDNLEKLEAVKQRFTYFP